MNASWGEILFAIVLPMRYEYREIFNKVLPYADPDFRETDFDLKKNFINITLEKRRYSINESFHSLALTVSIRYYRLALGIDVLNISKQLESLRQVYI